MAKISKLYWIAPDFSKYDYISSLCILYASEKYNKSRLGRLTALVPLLSQSILLVLPPMGHWGQATLRAATLSPRRWGQTTLRADDFEGRRLWGQATLRAGDIEGKFFNFSRIMSKNANFPTLGPKGPQKPPNLHIIPNVGSINPIKTFIPRMMASYIQYFWQCLKILTILPSWILMIFSK